MPEHQPDLSIIIVTYNSAAVIAPCLRSIASQGKDLNVETLVVDNASTDDTTNLIHREFPWANLIAGDINIGFAAANNVGFKAARGRHFFVLNPDTETHPGALQHLLRYADTHQKAGMIAPRVINTDGSLQHSTFQFPDFRQAFYGFFERLVPIDSVANGRYPLEAYSNEREVEHILGAAIFVQRALWEQIGGMDEGYALYFEETDWCYRARKAGWELRYIPTATIMHHGAHSTSTAPELSSVMFAHSQARFYRNNLGLLNYVLLKMVAIIGILSWLTRSFLAIVRGRISAGNFMRRLHSYWRIILA